MTDRNDTGIILPIQAKKDGRKGGNRKKRTQAQFLALAKKAHNNFYSYENTQYVGSREKILITCHIHGDFEQSAQNHLRGYGCKKCGTNKTRLTKKDFTKRANERFDNKFDYSLVEFTTSTDRVAIICPEHGTFYQTVAGHLNGTGCKKCNGTVWTNERFIKTAADIHKNKYDYSLVDVDARKSKTDKVEIICPIHGVFTQEAKEHLKGSGCLKCAKESAGWKKSDFVRKCTIDGNDLATLYVVECKDNGEIFFKVGITSKSVEHRFRKQTYIPYNFKSIYEVVNTPEFIYDLEHKLHALLKEYRYKPSLKFRGYTECFTTIKPIENLLKLLTHTEQLQLIA